MAQRWIVEGFASILQSFRPDYPFHGSRTAQFRQVGDACAPRMVAHVLAAAMGIPVPDDLLTRRA